MAGMSTNLRNKILDKIFNDVDFSCTTVVVSLHSADPGITGASELAATGAYARAAAEAGVWGSPATGSIANDGVVTFPTATADWATATHFGVWDSSGFLWGGALGASRTVTNGTTFSFPVAALTAGLT